MKMSFYRCPICGQIISIVKDTNLPVICCGQRMLEITACSEDASIEKHVPVFTVSDNKVEVNIGSSDHPMTEDHYIEWIALQTNSGNQRKILKPGDKPHAVFYIGPDDKVKSIYAYCNIHSLWNI